MHVFFVLDVAATTDVLVNGGGYFCPSSLGWIHCEVFASINIGLKRDALAHQESDSVRFHVLFVMFVVS